ncbi:MAG: LacI family DNA-binding transcriptional regulator [Candidatus Goldbacteria bacterium]|nr:LacI family DNA-binding transcriptional regulator [Candidatus Goldiibacteriota bacterium]
MKPVTIKDIAKKIDISYSTVSRALNNDEKINIDTRRLVKETAEAMSYFPNLTARGLVKGGAESIAFISTRFAAPFISSILDTFEQEAFYSKRYVHGIIPYSTRNEGDVRDNLLKSILKGRKADAVVMLTIKPPRKILDEYNRVGIPVLLIENRMKGAYSITLDNNAGAKAAAEHLIKRGSKNICLIVGETVQPPSREKHIAAVERKTAFLNVLQKHGVKLKENCINTIHAYTHEEGKESVDRFLKNGIKPDAVFCAAGDIVAMGVMERLKELKYRIPEDVAVIGYDDILAARHLNPPLTTVRQPLEEIGAMAFKMIIDAIDGKNIKRKSVLIKPDFVIRKSA